MNTIKSNHVTEGNGFSIDEIERFEIIRSFRYIRKILRTHFTEDETSPIYKAMIKAQDRVIMEQFHIPQGTKRDKRSVFCKHCKKPTFHLIKPDGNKCVVCRNIT
jgi:hypothetical protein